MVTNTATFRFIDYGEHLGTRAQGERVRADLLPVIQSHDLTILDFDGVTVVSNSFADECIAKLLHTYPLEELKKRTTFHHVADFPRHCISVAISRRHAAV